MTVAEAYVRRFEKVLVHIDMHLHDELSVEELSRVAALSKYHFHRQFRLVFGLSVHQYVSLVRLQRAVYQLAFSGDRILDIALATGYESHEAFTRAFKRALGQTPSGFREQPAWREWSSSQKRLQASRARHHIAALRPGDVQIVQFPETSIAVLEHRGDARLLGNTLRQFVAWRKRHGPSPRVSATFNIVYDAPDDAAPEAFRFDVCAAADAVAENAFGVAKKRIPGGRCAVLVHTGSDDALFGAVEALFGDWLPSSGEKLRDFPLFVRRIDLFPYVSEREAKSEIYLPLA